MRECLYIYRTSIFVVKAYKNFVEQMSDHDDLLQHTHVLCSICH